MVVLVYTKEEVAELLKVKPSWIARRCSRRMIPFTMLGGQYRFTEEHIQEIIKIHEQKPYVSRNQPSRWAPSPNTPRLVARTPPRLRKLREQGLT